MVSGGYCTHGETFLAENDVIWWAKGGKLKGESPARIAFLKAFVESLPGPIEPLPGQYDTVFQMQPEQLPQLLEAVPPSAKGFAMAVRMNSVEREVMASGEDVYRGKCVFQPPVEPEAGTGGSVMATPPSTKFQMAGCPFPPIMV